MVERSGPPPTLESCRPPSPDPAIEELASGLEVIWDLAPVPDGRLFLTERPGRIRVIEDGVLQVEPWFELDVEAREEAGLLGMTLSRDFDQTGHLFVVSTHLRPPPAGGAPVIGRVLRSLRARVAGDRGTAVINRVHRITDHEGRGTDPVLWIDGLPSGILHAGGALLTLPSGDLLVSLGDGMDPWRAQQPSSLRGSILRVPVGPQPPPSGRLHASEHLVALGVRNSQGMTFVGADSTEILFIDHGPVGRDELNRLERGANFGWPAEAGIVDEPRFTPPLVEWTPSIAPGGIASRVGGHFDESSEEASQESSGEIARVWVTGLGGQVLVEVRLARATGPGTEWRAICQDTILSGEYGRLRAIAPAPDGGLFVGTSNQDGRGIPREGGDRVLHLRWDSDL
ncbi:MAG: hypothetical protein EA351_00630 [Gemmatimonadales bacterium]|nr:MAG: hypothetical protein EA351_00630 [Gemmatimonadales bacterium]